MPSAPESGARFFGGAGLAGALAGDVVEVFAFVEAPESALRAGSLAMDISPADNANAIDMPMTLDLFLLDALINASPPSIAGFRHSLILPARLGFDLRWRTEKPRPYNLVAP
jgi:hypothetical protein